MTNPARRPRAYNQRAGQELEKKITFLAADEEKIERITPHVLLLRGGRRIWRLQRGKGEREKGEEKPDLPFLALLFCCVQNNPDGGALSIPVIIHTKPNL